MYDITVMASVFFSAIQIPIRKVAHLLTTNLKPMVRTCDFQTTTRVQKVRVRTVPHAPPRCKRARPVSSAIVRRDTVVRSAISVSFNFSLLRLFLAF